MLVLVCLAADADRVVPKEQLMRTVWPDTFVGDDVLTRCISELRRVFGDDVKEPRFIQTIPKSGYRLIAPVSSDRVRELVPRRRGTVAQATPYGLVLTVGGIVLLTGVAVGGWWLASSRRGSGGPHREPTLTQLTANPPDVPVTTAQVSPDGKYLAYADPTGIQVRVIDTGDTQRIADTRGMGVYAWTADGTQVRAAKCDSSTCTGWDLPWIGSTRRRSGAEWPAADFVVAAPDGSRLLRIPRSSRDVWFDALDGSAPRHVVHLGEDGSASWSADGERVLFTRGTQPLAVESIPLAGGPSSVVFAAPDGQRIASTGLPLGNFLQLTDGRLLTLLRDAETDAVTVWEVSIDRRSGAARGAPRRLTEARAGGNSVGLARGFWLLSASSDGKRVVLKTDTSHSDMYVARFDERQGRLLDTPRRLTVDERGGTPGVWTPDGQRIVFSLGQSGSQDLFTVRPDAESAEPLVTGPGNQVVPCISNDGHWVLFLDLRPSAQGTRLMRVPLAGGRPEEVLVSAQDAYARCPFRSRCVLFEQDGERWNISALDPVRGKGERLGSTPFNRRGQDLSPDGTAVALIVEGSDRLNRIRIYSLRGEPQKDVVAENASALAFLDWAATGAGFFSSNLMPERSELLFIRLDGTSHVLWSQQGGPIAAIPSRDGTHLAIAGWTRQANMWMLTDF